MRDTYTLLCRMDTELYTLGSSLEIVLQSDLGLEEISDDEYMKCWRRVALYPMLVRRYFMEDIDQKKVWRQDLEDALCEYVGNWVGEFDV